MVLLNTCNSGLDFAEYISKNCNVISLGWLGYVEDKLSVDFALFFYQRMLDGASPIEATKAFTQNIGVWNEIPLTAPLVTWLPYIEAGIQPMFQVADKAAMSTDQVAEFATKQIGEEAAILIPPLSVNVDWNVASAINPALSKNGRPAITRMSLQCSRPANNLRLEIICDTGFGSSSFRRMLALVEGVQPISTENIHFPVLHELIERKAERRQINFTVTVAEGNTVLAQDTQSALWMQTNEWMGQSETWPFIPAFVIPNCDVVRTIFDKAIRQLKNIGSPSNDFNGYENEDPVFVDLQMRAIFQTLRDESLKYINPPASPIYVPDNFKPSGQLVRFPDEILLHKRGTCQDLSLLLAACAEHVGIYPLIVLVQGHTFCGYWKDRDAYRVFWEQLPPIERYSGFGRSWIIQDEQKLVDLVTKESLQLMEPTYLTDESWTFERGCQKWGGVRFEKKIQNRRFDVAIDIWASRIAIQPISVN